MIKHMLQKGIKNMDKMLLIFILIASTLCIRNEMQYQEIPIIINIVMLGYLIIRQIKKKPISLIETKLDLFITLLVLSTVICFLTNTYISLHATVNTILSYCNLFWIYILTKEMGRNNQKYKEILIDIMIILTVLLIFLGIENLTTNKIFEFLGINYIINGEGRLVSLFGNPNTLAVLIIFSYFLSIHKCINKTSVIQKVMYSTINTILIIGFILTYSKLMFLIFPVMLLFYMFGVKDKQSNIYIIQNICISFVIAIIYVSVFQQLVVEENYIAILVFSIFSLILSVLFHPLNAKTTKYLEKIKIKTIIGFGILLFIMLGIWVKIELQRSKEFVVFHENSSIDYQAKKLKNIQPNQKYIFCFDMYTKMDLVKEEDAQDLFAINIIQRDSKNKEITAQEEKFGRFSGMKEIEVQTKENTSEIKIEFTSKYQYMMKQWTIYSFTINGKEKILEYKNLPTKLVEKIQDINIHYKTAQERFMFIKDGLKLISQNFLTGIGGEGWQYKYREVQEYDYDTNDPHSYFIQVWLEFGIFGVISLCGIMYLVIRQKNDTNRGIKFAILTLLFHSMLDSDMYFFTMKLILFLSLGMLVETKENVLITEKFLKNKVIHGMLIIICMIIILLYSKPKIYQKNLKVEEIEAAQIGLKVDSDTYKRLNEEMVVACDEVLKYEKDSFKQMDYEVKKIQAYIVSGQKDVEPMVQQFYEKIVDFHNLCDYDTKKIIAKSNAINKVINLLQNQENPQLYKWIMKLCEKNREEWEVTKEKLEKAIQTNYKETEKEADFIRFVDNYKNTLQIYDKYYFGIAVQNTTDLDIKQYLTRDSKMQIDNTEDIIIYHTHTTEGYGIETKEAKTLDANYNVLKIGKTLKESLEEKGFHVMHLQDYHDIEGIEGAYNRSFATLERELRKQSEKVDIVFDIHRDAFETGNEEKNCIEIDGKKVAKLRFVIAIGHQNWEENLKWAIALQKKADERYPGLFKPLLIYDHTYNQSATKYATLIEVGNQKNTVEEAERSMIYFSNIIDNVIQK